MKWRRTDDPDLIVCPPYFIRRCGRYVLGRDMGRDVAECLGGFDSADEAKAEAERLSDED